MRNKSWGETKISLLDKIIQKLRYHQVLKHINKASSLLDLGCGYNADFLNSIDNIKQKMGIDLSVNQKIKYPKITLKKGMVDKKIDLKDNSFDYITALALIEHVNNQDIMLAETYRLLKKSGSLIITTPFKNSKPLLEFLAYKLKVISITEIRDHKRYYNIDSLTNALIKAGFKKDKIYIKYFNFLNIIAKATK